MRVSDCGVRGSGEREIFPRRSANGLGCVDINSERYQGGCQANERQEVTSSFFVACGDAPIVLNSIDESLNQVALFVFSSVIASLDISNFQRRNYDFSLARLDSINQSVCVVGFVRNDGRGLMICQQLFGTGHVVLLTRA